jgi:hypothetical protein
MAVWNSLWSFFIFFPFWYVWTKKNLATQITITPLQGGIGMKNILTFIYPSRS